MKHPLKQLLTTAGYRVILASASPRRQELLAGLGIDFSIKVLPDVDESYPPTLQAEAIPLHIARTKAAAYQSKQLPDELIITADTIVWLDGKVLGKPMDDAEACEMLRMLSGKTHQVITGVCLTTTAWQRSFSAMSEVTFATLTDEEIAYYVANYHPMDKAGAYGVQEWIGYIGVEKIIGSFYNVMGLPIQRLYKELMKLV
ncbi:septum formation protein Maf [Bacteroides sp. 214]|uniref:Maf-like protein n=1 Tax=Bacteroides sp. 214 TaxID=2302935 RepID=UPI0013D614A0|nr:Maf-like protein [Bacteroides sp. 214]NDW12369.1 septum formation protein Maf [Bacteroides sp. 214]